MLNNIIKTIPRILSENHNVNIQFVRHRRVNLKRPRAPTFEKAQILAACKPIYPKPCDFYFPPNLRCRLPLRKAEKRAAAEEDNPYQRILAKELSELIHGSKMILILHENSIIGEEEFDTRITFQREGILLSRPGRETLLMATENTIYEAISALFMSKTVILTSPDVKLSKALHFLKKKHHLILLGGVVENKFLSRSQLEEIGKLDLTSARSQLVSVLNAASSHLVQYVSQPQMNLVTYLDQYVNLKNEGESSASVPEDTNNSGQ